MKLTFAEKAWEDYLYWQRTDKTYIPQVNLDSEYFLRHYRESGDRKFSYYQKA